MQGGRSCRRVARGAACAAGAGLMVTAAGWAAESPVTASALASPATVTAAKNILLPRQHAYQRTLRTFMATLKEADFQPEHHDLTVVPVAGDADEQFRMWILSLGPPAVGRKRNHSSVMIKPAYFTLDSIEGATAIMRPPAHPEPLMDLANWNYTGNPYFNSRPLRLRAFVLVALDLIMLDNLLDTAGQKDQPNQDQLVGGIGRFAYVFPGFSDAVPGEVRDAYLAGLQKLVRRALDHGPKALTGRTQGMYTAAVPALCLAAKVLNDPAITQEVEAYARRIFTEEPFFRAAGYFPHGGTLDSFNGISTYFALWGTLAADWPFAREAMARSYRLKAHLTLPEPDGALVGPSHMSSLTSSEPVHDQWDWRTRAWAAAMVTDEAACLAKMPAASEVTNAVVATVTEINAQLHELSWAPGGIDPAPWTFQSSGTLINFAYQYYPKGFYARRLALEQQDMARLPVLRDGPFIRAFSDEFLVAKTPTHTAIIHMGPIADPSDPDSGYGFGGGALSAFWTRATGAVILGRGIGAWSPRYKTLFDTWRSLPTHAVSGMTADGKVFTSAHIVKPEITVESKDNAYTVTARGLIPPSRRAEGKLPSGVIEYARTFASTTGGVRIATTLKADGQDAIAELYETLPVFLRDLDGQRQLAPTTIEFQAQDQWAPATTAFQDNVTAIRLKRFEGAVTIAFDRPRRVKLSPEDWADTYMSHAACRTILVDLLENGDRPTALKTAAIGYVIGAGAKL